MKAYEVYAQHIFYDARMKLIVWARDIASAEIIAMEEVENGSWFIISVCVG